MNIKPIHDRILVKAEEAEKQTTGGIIIANAKNEGIVEGKVLAVGKGTHDEKGNFNPTSVEVGARILFHIASGEKFEHEKEDYIMLPESEVIAVLV